MRILVELCYRRTFVASCCHTWPSNEQAGRKRTRPSPGKLRTWTMLCECPRHLAKVAEEWLKPMDLFRERAEFSIRLGKGVEHFAGSGCCHKDTRKNVASWLDLGPSGNAATTQKPPLLFSPTHPSRPWVMCMACDKFSKAIEWPLRSR